MTVDLENLRPPRKRNPRGQGHRLREDIVTVAAAILEATGNESAVTLRAIARQIGIASPSISAHFADQAAIIDAVVAQELAALTEAIHTALDTATDPVEQLYAAGRAYLTFSQASPNRYRVIFERRFLPDWADQQRTMTQTYPAMNDTITMIVDTVKACVQAGRSDSTDPYADTLTLWCALHGLSALPAAITTVPWPDHDAQLINMFSRLARIHD